MSDQKPKSNVTLFELVGKSTLKVPKNAGALKIPSWWSSKTNPPTVTIAGQPKAAEDESVEEGAQEVGPPTGTVESSTPATTEMKTDKENSGTEAQRGSKIPVRTQGARPVEKRPSSALLTAGLTPTAAPRQPGRVFAPQSFDPGRLARKQAGQPRVPMFATVAGILFICLVILVGILLMRRPGVEATVTTPSRTAVAIQNPAPPPVPIRQPRANLNQPDKTAGAPAAGGPAQQPAPSPTPVPTLKIVPGHVLAAGQVKREADYWYLVICSAPSERIAAANAQFVVDHGMSDVTIEQRSNGMFSVISAQGFGKIDADAEALRKFVIEVGKQHPDFKKQKRSVYWDAYYRKVQRTN